MGCGAMSNGTFGPLMAINSAFSLLSSRVSSLISPRLRSTAAASISSSVLIACVVSGSSCSRTRSGRMWSSVLFGTPVSLSDGVCLLAGGGTAGNVLLATQVMLYVYERLALWPMDHCEVCK